MRLQNVLLLISVSLLCASLSSHAAERATLTAGPRILLAEEGSGLWALTVRRDPQGGGLGPSGGVAVDSDGYIYVPDTFGNKILVFTKDGQRHQVLTTEELYHPIKIIVDEDGVLHVDAGIKNKGEYTQYTVTRHKDRWAFSQKQKAELAPGAGQPDMALSMTAPFGRDGLKYLTATTGYRYKLQLVDKDNNFVKFVPCRWHDQKGRYYKHRYDVELDKNVVSVLDESGKLLGEIVKGEDDILSEPVMYRGWVYFVEKKDGKCCLLRRYAQDGTLEHEIELVGLEEERAHLGPLLVISPNSEYCFVRDAGGNPGFLQLWIQRMTYREEKAEQEEGSK